MTVLVFDERQCSLGEGAFWHPEREQFFWLDILNRLLLTRVDDVTQVQELPETISAMGWIDRDRLLLAGESRFWIFDLVQGVAEPHTALEADRPGCRSNDGRADPFGGFWIGTMEWDGEPGRGRIWRYLQGQVTELYCGLAIPNAICFTPDREFAYFTDTPTGVISRVRLDREGWPAGEPQEHIQIAENEGFPDGAIVDTNANLWVALWGGGRVVGFDANGQRIGEIDFPARQSTCPSLGGPGLQNLFVTSAAQGLDDPEPADGQTFFHQWDRRGQREHRVVPGSNVLTRYRRPEPSRRST